MRGMLIVLCGCAVCMTALAQSPAAPRGAAAGATGDTRAGAATLKNSAAGRARTAPRSTQAILSQPVPEVRFEEVAFEDVLAQLAELGRVNLVVQWGPLELVGVERDKPISLRLRRLPFRDVLQLVLREAAGNDARLAYRAVGNLIVVSTAEAFGEELLTRTYDINDLLVEEVSAPDIFVGRVHDYIRSVRPRVAAGAVGLEPEVETAFSGTQVRYPTGRNGYGGGAGIGPGGFENIGRREDEQDASGNRATHIAQLIEAITQTIEPDSWAVNGGRGTIREFRGLLVVRASPFVHQALGGPLRAR